MTTKRWTLPSGRKLEWDGLVLTFLTATDTPLFALPKKDVRTLFTRLKGLYRD